MLSAEIFFSLSGFEHAAIFDANNFVWSGLTNLKNYMNSHSYPQWVTSQKLMDGSPLSETLAYHNGKLISSDQLTIEYGDTTKGQLVVKQNGKLLEGASILMAGAILVGDSIDLGRGVLVETGAMIKSPAILGDYTEVRQGAYLRGYTLAGRSCVIGHTTEVKHSIFLNDAKAGHFNYIGDSILGANANLGAGTKFANLRFLDGNVRIRYKDQVLDTGMRKFGAILGDNSQTGCNSVTNPGTLLGKKCMLMPNTTAKAGYYPDQTVIK